MEGTLENKVAKASTMLANAAEELRVQVGRARGSLALAHQERTSLDPVGSSAPLLPEDLEERRSLVGLPP
jgi:hypothetical protein